MYGASAGAINATYFLTGQREGVDIYCEDIANKLFLDLSRLVGRSSGAHPTLLGYVGYVRKHAQAPLSLDYVWKWAHAPAGFA